MESILKAENISKYDRDIAILKNISMEFYPGQITCIIGENGAGKTMLAKVLSGHESFDNGNLYIRNKAVKFHTPLAAFQQGVYLLSQEQNLQKNLSVMDNLCLNNKELEKLLWKNPRRLREYCKKLLKRVNLDIDPDTYVKDIELREQKLIELARLFSYDGSFLILDEPTAPLYEHDINLVYRLLKEEAQRNKSIILISHSLENIGQICDRIIVLRNGELQEDCPVDAHLDYNHILKAMKGKLYLNRYPKSHHKIGNELLRTERLHDKEGTISDVSFSVREGEIVGIAGIEGAGKSTLLRMLFGLQVVALGKVFWHGQEVNFSSPRDAIQANIAYVSNYAPNDLFPQQNASDNLNVLRWSTSHIRIPSLKSMKEFARKQMVSYRINIADSTLPITRVSTGAQQKISLARWMCRNTHLYIMDDPSNSLDISSKVDFYNIINTLVQNSCGVLISSSDLNELIGMCDRILVLKAGSIIHNIIVKDFAPEVILDTINTSWYPHS